MHLPPQLSPRTVTTTLLVAVLVAVLAAIGLPTAAHAAPGAYRICTAATAEPIGTATSVGLKEISGLGASARYPNVLWAHNDSGDGPRLYALGKRGGAMGSVGVAPAHVDWEDMAIVPWGAGNRDRIYLADMGDNGRSRDTITLYRTAEPGIVNRKVARRFPTTAITLRYPDGPHDAEVLLVDPLRRDVVIVTKEQSGLSGIYAVTTPITGARELTMRKVGEVNFSAWSAAQLAQMPDDAPLLAKVGGGLATGGDVSRNGRVVAIRTYGGVLLFNRKANRPLWTAFNRQPCVGASIPEGQGEAIAFDPSGRGYVTIGEGVRRPIHHTVIR